MTIKERIRRIILIEKLNKHSEYAKHIGVSARLVNKSNEKEGR